MQHLNSTQIPNQILELIYTGKVTLREARILAFICRKTIGWNKETDWLTLGHIEKYTGMARSHVSDTIRSLIAKKFLTRDGHEGHYIFSLNFSTAITKSVTPYYRIGNPGVTKSVTNKRHYTKDTNTKSVTRSRPNRSVEINHGPERAFTKAERERIALGIYPK